MTSRIDTDLLTRTTLQVDGTMPSALLADMIRALQRVPGVLLAEVNAANARAVVAHDAAVPATSLIAAAQNAGVRVRIVSDARSPMRADNVFAQPRSLRSRQLLIVAAVAFVILAIVDSLVPNDAQKHGILMVLTASLWAFFLAKAFMGHR